MMKFPMNGGMNVVVKRKSWKVASYMKCGKMSKERSHFSRSLWVHSVVELFALWTSSAQLLNPQSPRNCSFHGLSATKSCRFDRRYALHKSSCGPLTMLAIAWAFIETKQARGRLDSCHCSQRVLQGKLLASTDARFQM